MAEAAKDQDQSMEDILQSIKRIIAEEGEPAPETAGSDVLELTDMVGEDSTVKPVESISIEEIMAAPISSTPPQAPEVKPVPAAPPAVAPEPKPIPSATDEESLMSKATLSASVSALNALRDSLTPVTTPRTPSEIAFRSGTTVEDLVVESLKPMLKDWIDSNLPGIVEALVKKEISKLTQ